MGEMGEGLKNANLMEMLNNLMETLNGWPTCSGDLVRSWKPRRSPSLLVLGGK